MSLSFERKQISYHNYLLFVSWRNNVGAYPILARRQWFVLFCWHFVWLAHSSTCVTIDDYDVLVLCSYNFPAPPNYSELDCLSRHRCPFPKVPRLDGIVCRCERWECLSISLSSLCLCLLSLHLFISLSLSLVLSICIFLFLCVFYSVCLCLCWSLFLILWTYKVVVK